MNSEIIGILILSGIFVYLIFLDIKSVIKERKAKKAEKEMFTPDEIIKKYRDNRQKINYPIGSKVISRSNENEPYKIGIIKDYQNMSKGSNMFPIVEIDGKEYLCMSIIRHYSETLCRILDKLTYKEQWNILAEFNIRD